MTCFHRLLKQIWYKFVQIINMFRILFVFTDSVVTAVAQWLRCCAYLLTYSMVPSPSWEANWFAASQEIPRISWNPEVHYRTHKRPPPIPILGHPNPVHIPTSHLLEIHPNIIHPSTPRSPQWSPSLRFPHQDPIHPPLLRCCATNRKVAGSIPDGVIGIFHWHNPSDRTMALGSTQTLTEMSTRSFSWGQNRLVRMADNLTTILAIVT